MEGAVSKREPEKFCDVYFSLFVFISSSARTQITSVYLCRDSKIMKSGLVVLFSIRVRNIAKMKTAWNEHASRYVQVQKIIFLLDEYQGRSINNNCPTLSINEIAYIWVKKLKCPTNIKVVVLFPIRVGEIAKMKTAWYMNMHQDMYKRKR
jgi:hypothetical protein